MKPGPHPADDLLRWLPKLDFAVLRHGWASHGRDYVLVVQDCLGAAPGTHEVTFTHCVRVDCESRVHDEVWRRSWGDEFTDHERWQEAGEPSGYVWGTNWSNAYPGIEVVTKSAEAESWTRRLGQPMFEVAVETDRFRLRLVFHSIRNRKLSDEPEPLSLTIRPLP